MPLRARLLIDFLVEQSQRLVGTTKRSESYGNSTSQVASASLRRYSKIRNTEKKNGLARFQANPLICLAEWTGLEPATPGVTGRYSNQLNYHSRWLLL